MILLQQLVQIPSVNPDQTPGDTSGITHELRVAKFLENYLHGIGAEVSLEEIEPGRPNLIARFAPLDGRPRILLGPHLDTVSVKNMTISPFSGEIRDGKVWGRGTSDTKGPMAAMLHALSENKEILPDLPIAVDFVAFMGEEAGQPGSKHFAKNHAHHYSFAIVGEPTSLQIVHTTKGSLWATLTTKGIAAHASQPETGDNAILKLADSLIKLQEKLEPALAAFTHPSLGHSTLNIGTIHGGTSPNIVPAAASATIDIRQTPSLAAAGGSLRFLQEVIREAGLPLSVSGANENLPMETDIAHPMIQQLLSISPTTKLASAPWFSDAAHLSAAGLPSICIGPGSIDQAHTKDEFITLADLDAGESFFSAFIKSLATCPPRLP